MENTRQAERPIIPMTTLIIITTYGVLFIVFAVLSGGATLVPGQLYTLAIIIETITALTRRTKYGYFKECVGVCQLYRYLGFFNGFSATIIILFYYI